MREVPWIPGARRPRSGYSGMNRLVPVALGGTKSGLDYGAFVQGCARMGLGIRGGKRNGERREEEVKKRRKRAWLRAVGSFEMRGRPDPSVRGASLPPIDAGADVCLCCSLPTINHAKNMRWTQGFQHNMPWKRKTRGLQLWHRIKAILQTQLLHAFV